MDDTWIVYDAEQHSCLRWLEGLARAAQAEQAAHPLRRQARVCHVGPLDLHKLPLPVRMRVDAAAGIYARLPSAAEPFGHLLALLLVEGVNARTQRMQIVTEPEFPLRVDEVRRHILHHFARAVRGAGGRRTGLLLAINQGEALHNGRTGAPVLACNVWLEEQLAALGPGRPGRRRLFRPWMEQYRLVRGCDPVDPMRSFRAAVAGCEVRLARRKPQDGGAP